MITSAAPWLGAEVTDATFDFFSTSAQIIPLIFLVLAFEFRSEGNQFLPADLQGKPDQTQTGDIRYYAAIYTVAMTLVLAIGESAALHVLASDDRWLGWKWIVGGSMTIGALGVIVPIALQQVATISKIRNARWASAPRTERRAQAPRIAEIRNVPQRVSAGHKRPGRTGRRCRGNCPVRRRRNPMSRECGKSSSDRHRQEAVSLPDATAPAPPVDASPQR